MDLARQARFWAKVDMSSGQDSCWLWTAMKIRGGYGMFAIGGANRKQLAHRVSWELANGPLPNDTSVGSKGTLVRHRCDNPACVNPRHLELGTQRDNVHDKLKRGRQCHKLRDYQIQAIVACYKTGLFSIRELATAFGVNVVSIFHVIHGRNQKRFEVT